MQVLSLSLSLSLQLPVSHNLPLSAAIILSQSLTAWQHGNSGNWPCVDLTCCAAHATHEMCQMIEGTHQITSSLFSSSSRSYSLSEDCNVIHLTAEQSLITKNESMPYGA